MKRKQFLLAILLSLIVVPLSAQVSFGSPEKINDQWKFSLNDSRDSQQPAFDDRQWQDIDIPHDWSVRGALNQRLFSGTGFLPGGVGWYRKTIHIPQERQGENVYLYFEGVYNRSEVFVNGQSLGVRPNGYISFMYDATPCIAYGKDNVIAVRVDHSRSADSRWYTGSGIYRNVWLVYANPVHIAQWGIFAYPQINKGNGILHIETEIENETAQDARLVVRHELVSPEGKTVARMSNSLSVASRQKGVVKSALNVSKPSLWDLDTPFLYQLKTTVVQNGKIMDETITATGFRTFTFDPDRGFALNGKTMKMKGVCIHHDAGVLGAAVPREVWKSRLLTLKEIGCNAIRTSHNPQAPDLYELCDELGLLVLNEAFDEWEFAKRKWLEGWNVGTPGFEGSYDFFEEWGERDLADMVRRDRNHLSVFAWSIGNEVDYPNDPYSHPVLDGKGENGFTQPIFGGFKKDAPDAMRLGAIAKRLVAVVKKYDPTRPTTAGLAGVAMSNETEYPAALDIAGYNYTESMYASDHHKYPARVIYGSENRHDLTAWKAVADNEYIFGQFLWTGIDFLGEAGRWPSRGSSAGLLNLAGFIKPRGYFRQSLWADKPVAYIGTYPTPGRVDNSRITDPWALLEAENPINMREERVPSMEAFSVWNYDEGRSIRVVCYTNAAKARLELNGKETGATKDYDANTGIIFWDIPFQSGKLEVIGLDQNNKEVVRYAVHTSKRPDKIALLSADNEVSKNKGVAQIVIRIEDENGIPVVTANDEITCRIIGPARLLGLEAGNQQDMGDYTDNRQNVYRGRLLAYIQATGDEGEIRIQFSSPWLKPLETVIRAK
jgi:hypothetical protein